MAELIPQADPRASYLADKAAIDAAVAGVLASGRYILGDEVTAFEREFAAFQDSEFGVGVANGTAALSLGLRALGVGPGDAVATVSHTAVATVAAIELVGAVPVLIDVDPYHTLEPDLFAATVRSPPGGRPIKAVIPVHLYGQAADMPAIAETARRHGIAILEDASQAHGAALGGAVVGHWGDITAYSLYPTKNLGAFGDGGVLTTRDEGLAAKLRSLREYGWGGRRYISEIAGDNSRLDELQAAILRIKLRRLAADNRRRGEIAAVYDAALVGSPIETPLRRQGARHVFHQYVVATDQRDRLREALRLDGIGTNIHYPEPIHLQPAYAGRVAVGESGCVRTERAAARILSLPMFPQLGDAEVSRVAEALKRFSASL